ncbi:MAG: prepilin-type N-terminal cleavage/methylation domain-containing protein [Candidatus Omnitrophica bacterium]|nr:prepilin-type N-terminal cleavage/methylation domain-containing protein [Candidatus Omnitrophota bacterium]
MPISKLFGKYKSGFTLVELMISTAVMVGVAVPTLMLFLNYLILMDINKNTTIAINDASCILESIRDVDPFMFDNITKPGNYPQGQDLSSRIGPKKLRNEAIYVTYQNPSADPLTITVTVNWQDEVRIRNRTLSLATMMTQR